MPPELIGKEVWRLTPNSLPGLSARGNWQVAIDQLTTEWSKDPSVILFFDELSRAARLGSYADDDGGGVDVATVLATAFKRLPGLCLAEATEQSWRRFTDSYSDYERIFLPVRIEEPPTEQAKQIILRVAEDLSVLHGLNVSESAVERAFDLSQRYALDRAQPGKTIDVLRDTLAVTQHAGGEQLSTDITLVTCTAVICHPMSQFIFNSQCIHNSFTSLGYFVINTETYSTKGDSHERH